LSRRCARKKRNKEFEETRGRVSERIPYARNEKRAGDEEIFIVIRSPNTEVKL
jgi:hypothetical protein